MTAPSGATLPIRLRGRWNHIADRIEAWLGTGLIALAGRCGVAGVFLQSGRTKVDGWLTVTDGTVYLFREEYKLPFIDPALAAHLAAYAEHLFPLLLILGLTTRLAATALLGMTAVIEIFVYPDAWPTHLTWAAVLLYLLARGAGRVSVDRLLGIR